MQGYLTTQDSLINYQFIFPKLANKEAYSVLEKWKQICRTHFLWLVNGLVCLVTVLVADVITPHLNNIQFVRLGKRIRYNFITPKRLSFYNSMFCKSMV